MKEQQNKGQEVSRETNMITVGIQDLLAQNTKTYMAKCRLFPGSAFSSQQDSLTNVLKDSILLFTNFYALRFGFFFL